MLGTLNEVGGEKRGDVYYRQENGHYVSRQHSGECEVRRRPTKTGVLGASYDSSVISRVRINYIEYLHISITYISTKTF